MKIITAISERLGKLFHNKKAAQVTTLAKSELPKGVAAEIQAAGGKIKSDMPVTDTFRTSTQAQESIMEKIEGLKGFRLVRLECQKKEQIPLNSPLGLIDLQNKLGDGWRVEIKKQVSVPDYLKALDELGIKD